MAKKGPKKSAETRGDRRFDGKVTLVTGHPLVVDGGWVAQ